MNTLHSDRRWAIAPRLLVAALAVASLLSFEHGARAADSGASPVAAAPAAARADSQGGDSTTTAVPSSAPPAIALPPPSTVPSTPAAPATPLVPPLPQQSGTPAAAPGEPRALPAPPAPAAPEPAPAAPAAAATPSTAPGGAPDATGGNTRSLDEQVQDLKKATLQLNRDLFILEEELLFPANTQVAVFVSVDVGDFFALDSVNLKIDNREVSNYLYTPREVSALLKGGVQRLYVGNLKSGQHELVAFFDGKGPNDRNYRRAASIRFEKGVGAKYLELKVTDRAHAQQPEFEIKDWE